jgi:cation diffusion facilitator family transporter
MVLTAGGVTWLGLVCNVVLAAAKVLAGLVFASQAILADGLHSVSDLITDLAVLAGLRASSRPADLSHPYGHRRIATLVAMFVGAGLLGAAGIIAYTAIRSLHGPADGLRSPVPLTLALATIPVKEFLFRITRYIGLRDGNLALRVNAWHHRSDAATSVAAAVGLAGVAVGGADWAFLDPLTAMVLAAFLAVMAVGIIRKAAGELIDRAPGRSALDNIRGALGDTPGVVTFHALRARQVGGKTAMDVHIQVEPGLTVAQGHRIAADLRRHIIEHDPHVIEVVVHVEPVKGTQGA